MHERADWTSGRPAGCTLVLSCTTEQAGGLH